jgi:glycosyltransferase involved in cell wall biosynthesis
MKRVAIMIRSLANGGAEKQALLLAATLARTYRVQLLVVSREPCLARHLEFIERHGLQHVFLPDNPLLKPFALKRHLRREAVDVLFTFLPGDTLLGALAGRWAGVPRIIGGLRNTRIARHKALVLRFLHNHLLDATISNSREAARVFESRGFAPSKLLVVPNGIELREAPPPRPPGPALRILTVARFVAKKDHRTALRSVAHAVRELADSVELTYTIVGYGPMETAIRGWIVEEGLQGRVKLALDPPELAPFYQEADVYLGASLHEGLSNSILEAMNHALPVVATTAGDTGWLVREGEGGHLAEPGDWKTLGAGLVRLSRDGQARAAMGASSHRRVSERFSLERLGDAYRGIIEQGAAAVDKKENLLEAEDS